jgi:hypothetical protein
MSLLAEERCRRRTAATESLAAISHRRDAAQVVTRLDDGLTLLRNLLYTRLQADVERDFGRDSMLMPLSHAVTEHTVKGEIEAFSAAEVLEELAIVSDLPRPAENRTWLFELRLAGRQDRAALETRADQYLLLESRDRQLKFSDMLEEIVHEARLAPLVLYQLFPLAVRAVAALAFGDHLRGGEIRNAQATLLPAITYCRRCHGRLMEVDETCRECGNPIWTIRWMTQAD